MSADSIATSVPAPIAMPTSASTSAGASFTPSPTIATVTPRFDRADFRRLLIRQHFGEVLVESQFLRDPPRHWLRIAGEHHRRDTYLLQPLQRLAGLGTDDIRERDSCGSCSVTPTSMDRDLPRRQRLPG